MAVYQHKYVTGQSYSHYANIDTLETNANFNYWRVDLVHSDSFVQVVTDVMTLTKDIVSGTDYRWYTSFTFPVVPNNCYRFLIIDTANSDAVLYISDELESVSSDTSLILFKYRNAKNILNFNYEGLPSFYNIFHVEVKKRKPNVNLSRDGYDLSSGTFKPVRTVRTKNYEFVTGWFDNNEHDAMSATLIHSDLQLGIDGNYLAYTLPEDGSYETDWQEDYEVITTGFRLEQNNESSSNKAI